MSISVRNDSGADQTIKTVLIAADQTYEIPSESLKAWLGDLELRGLIMVGLMTPLILENPVESQQFAQLAFQILSDLVA